MTVTVTLKQWWLFNGINRFCVFKSCGMLKNCNKLSLPNQVKKRNLKQKG